MSAPDKQMIERVANAIWQSEGFPDDLSKAHQSTQERLHHMAQAALSAITPPNGDEVREALGDEALGDYLAWADDTAYQMRDYYEANRPLRWWEKRNPPGSWGCIADNLMLGLLNIALDAFAARAALAKEKRG